VINFKAEDGSAPPTLDELTQGPCFIGIEVVGEIPDADNVEVCRRALEHMLDEVKRVRPVPPFGVGAHIESPAIHIP
jgi:hypothetical protein